MIRQLTPGVPTGVGSLPYTDVNEAVRAVLALQPELPAAPQLPRRTAVEGMLAQVATGMAGVTVEADGSLTVDRKRLGPIEEGSPLAPDAWAATLAFLTAVGGRRKPIKLQLAGPVTVGLALCHAGARPGPAFAAAAATVRSRVHALLDAAAAACPDTPILLVLDEPGMVRYLDTAFPLAPDETIDLLSTSLAAAAHRAITGVHCCGPTDWRLVLHAGPDVVSVPVDAGLAADANGFASFIERGGWVAWGAVPTERPLGDRDDLLWRRLAATWAELAAGGCDPVRLRAQSLITPACGLAMHRPEQVAHIFGLTRHLAERVQDQAMAMRMSVGA